MRSTCAIIDFKNILHNLLLLKSRLSKNVKICPVVKANAYGHGLVEVSRAIEDKCDFLAVFTVEEALLLKMNNIRKNIIVMGGFLEDEAESIIEHNFIPFVFEKNQLKILERAGHSRGKTVEVFLKFDTGMGRLGFFERDLDDVMNFIGNSKVIKLKGISSHFAYSDLKNMECIAEQLKAFEGIKRKLSSFKDGELIYTIANSAGTLTLKESHYDMVRPGISLYGVSPFSEEREEARLLKPALSLITRILSIKRFPAGRGISYSHTFITRRESIIGIIPIGYADGFWRMESNRGIVLVKGKRCPVVGNVCMDLTMIDLTDVPGAQPGDKVTIIGEDGDEKITVHEVARRLGTISYEVLVRISERVRREYKN